jgi:hypothetical protein
LTGRYLSDPANWIKVTVSKEGCRLIAICVVDALLTIALVAMGLAKEANPLMAQFLNHGFCVFYLAKLATVLPAVAIAELYRLRNPLFIKKLLQTVTAGYLALYFILVITVNSV